MKKFILISLAVIFGFGIGVGSLLSYKRYYNCDFAVIGTVKFADGIGRQTIGLMDCLCKDFSIQYIKHTGGVDSKDLPKSLKKIVHYRYKDTAHVLIFEDPLLSAREKDYFPSLPNSEVKIAYSMVEGTRVPQNWVKILNDQFHAIAVPDQFLVEVYQKSGVQIPIFVLPLGMYIEPFLEKNHLRTKPQGRPFVFGSLGAYISRKNQATLIAAFGKAFGNDPNVQLVLNGRFGDSDYLKLVQEMKRSQGLDNVAITNLPLRFADYIAEHNSFDCYVSPSKGEGFSLQPREALALGVPTVVTDNTAQSTVCQTGYVKAVPSQIPVKAYYKFFEEWHDDLGLQFECEIDALAASLREVYENYELYAANAAGARSWLEQYRYDQLHPLYETLVLPKKVVLSDHNAIEAGVIYTTSCDLKERYERVIAKQNPLRKILNSVIIALQ